MEKKRTSLWRWRILTVRYSRLQLEDSKSRLLQSGAYIARAKQKSGECIRLQTFDFLGFTFYCGRSRKGMPYIMPKTSSKKFRQKIRDIKVWLYANRDQPLKKLMGMLNLKLIGHYRYYGISFNVQNVEKRERQKSIGQKRSIHERLKEKKQIVEQQTKRKQRSGMEL